MNIIYEKEIYTNPEKYKIYVDNESYIPDYNHYLRNFEYNNRCDCTTKWIEIGYHYKILRWIIDDNDNYNNSCNYYSD